MPVFRSLVSFVTGLLIAIAPVSAAPQIAVLLKSRIEYWTEVEQGATEAGKALGVELTVMRAPAADNFGAQLKQLGTLATKPVDAVVLSPTDPVQLKESVAALQARGAKIVALETSLGSEDALVAVDQAKIADAAVNEVTALTTDGSKIVVFRGQQNDLFLVRREKLMLDALKKLRPASSIVANIYADPSDAEIDDKAARLLSANPDAQAIFCTTTFATEHLLRALQHHALAGKVRVVGFGVNLPAYAVDAMHAQQLHGWVAQLPRRLGYKSVEAAVALVQGKPTPKQIDSDFMLVTPETLDDPAARALVSK